ncbi:MAG: hypothetical protein R2798_02955 [Chitinophagales bacterium]|nr:DUF4249 family protein [Bacteroidota bacterium]MCB9042289.1 DUF4249 family protein [Chitinophagales bacterium]
MQNKFILLLILLVFASSCSTDVDINTDWQENTIVYGLLDQRLPTQYIRVNKAFLDANTSALQIAQIADSLYYKNAIVTVEEYTSYDVSKEGLTTVYGNPSRIFSLEKVNAADEGIEKEDGFFATEPYFVYKFDTEGENALQDNRAYRLHIVTDSGKEVWATTPLVYEPSVGGQANDFFRQPRVTTQINFTLPTATNVAPPQIRVEFDAPTNGAIYDMFLLINYNETEIANSGNVQAKVLKMPLFVNFENSDFDTGSSLTRKEYKYLDAMDVLLYMSQHIAANDMVYRDLTSIDFIADVATQDVKNFIDIGLAAQTSISQGQFSPEFTNITNGLGLFGARTRYEINIPNFTNSGLDELGCGSVSGGINFAPSPGNVHYPFCP